MSVSFDDGSMNRGIGQIDMVQPGTCLGRFTLQLAHASSV